MQKSIGRAGRVFLIVAAVSLIGCGRNSSTIAPASGSAASSSGSSSSKSAAKPGYIIGKITRPDGSAIAVDGSKFTVTVVGVAGTGNEVEYSPQVDANGEFSSPLASGIYHVAGATMRLPFNGTTFTYSLAPTTMTGDMQSDAGIVSDFVWQVSGPLWTCKDNPDPANYTDWFGGSCTLLAMGVSQDSKGVAAQCATPVGASFVFTATPQGKMIDGNDGKPRTWTCKWADLGLTPTLLNDMPPTAGGWLISGQETDPDGSHYGILFKSPNDPLYVAAAHVQFAPSGSGLPGFWPPPLMIARGLL